MMNMRTLAVLLALGIASAGAACDDGERIRSEDVEAAGRETGQRVERAADDAADAARQAADEIGDAVEGAARDVRARVQRDTTRR